jgi:nitrogen regulatory protein P-II 1
MNTGISLIVTIVDKGWGDTVLEASIKAGAEGGTVMIGRGIGVHENQKILGIAIEPEKEIVLSVTHNNMTDAILNSIISTCNLERPGAGIAFVLPVDRVAGIAHIERKE